MSRLAARPQDSSRIVVALSILLTLLAGCASSVKDHVTTTVDDGVQARRARAVLVRLVDVQRPDATAWDAHDRTSALLLGITGRGLVPLAPWEVSILSDLPDDAPLGASSTLATSARSLGVDPEDVVVLRSWVTRRSATVIGGKVGRATSVMGADEDVAVRLTLRDPQTGQLIGSAEVDRAVDPFAPAASRPWGEVLLGEGLEALLAAVDDAGMVSLGGGMRPVALPSVIEDPRSADDFRMPGGDALAEHLARLDALDADLLRLERAERVAPDDALDVLDAFAGRAPGLLARGADASWRLRDGDLITAVDGRAVRQTWELARAVLVHRGSGPLVISVERGGATRRLEVPWPVPAR